MQGTGLIRSGGDVVDTTTGEVITPRVDMVAYLSRLAGDDGITEQRALAAAYDRACNALIGENDVQKEGNRTFKKKSAWRKLARHFGISTSVMNVQKEIVGEGFLATVTVRASAPWGQYAEAVGACGTDEATGKRVITTADAIATAETRATNRAVSNLVAMGEVSAEEMSKGSDRANTALSKGATNGFPDFRSFPMPFGKDYKDRPLMDIPDDKLASALDWAAEKGKFQEFQEAGEKEMEYRKGGSSLTPDDVEALQL